MIDAILIVSSGVRRATLLARHYRPTDTAARDTLEFEALRTLDGAVLAQGRWFCSMLKDDSFVVYSGRGDLVFVLVGSGDDDEIALFEVGRAIIDVASEHCGGRLDAEHCVEQYGKIALGIDEMINCGFVEHLDKQTVMRQSKLKPFAKN